MGSFSVKEQSRMLAVCTNRKHPVSENKRFERIASTAAVRTHRKNERFSLAPELLILLLGKPQALNFRIENTS